MKGWGKFAGANELEVALLDGGNTTVNAKNFIIATGSEVSPLPGMKIDEERSAPLQTQGYAFWVSMHVIKPHKNASMHEKPIAASWQTMM